MRTIGGALEQQQNLGLAEPGKYGTPLVAVTIDAKDGSNLGDWVNLGPGARVYKVISDEQPFAGTAQVLLRNNDKALTGIDFRGGIVHIRWGYYEVGETSLQQPYWVIDQQDISREGELLIMLQCGNAWELLAYSTGTNILEDTDLKSVDGAGSPRTYNRDMLIMDIVQDIVADPNGFLTQWDIPYNGLQDPPGSDGIVDSYQPLLLTEINDNDRDILRKVLSMSKSIVRMADNGIWLIYINPDEVSPAYQFDLTGLSAPFYSKVKGQQLPIPNRVFFANVAPNVSSGVVAAYVGTAVDQDSIDKIGSLARIYFDESIESDGEAQSRAESAIARIRSDSLQGELVVPMITNLEVYDVVQVTDDRGGASMNARIGQITRTFESSVYAGTSQRETYSCKIVLGGIGDSQVYGLPQPYHVPTDQSMPNPGGNQGAGPAQSQAPLIRHAPPPANTIDEALANVEQQRKDLADVLTRMFPALGIGEPK